MESAVSKKKPAVNVRTASSKQNDIKNNPYHSDSQDNYAILTMLQEQGFNFFECLPDNPKDPKQKKKPLGKGWQLPENQLTVEAAQLIQSMGTLIGAAIPPGYITIDIDCHGKIDPITKKVINGKEEFAKVCDLYGIPHLEKLIKETYATESGQGGGIHLYYYHKEAEKLPYNFAPEVQAKCGTGYMIAPGSKGYKALNNNEPAELPEEFLRVPGVAIPDSPGKKGKLTIPLSKEAIEKEFYSPGAYWSHGRYYTLNRFRLPPDKVDENIGTFSISEFGFHYDFATHTGGTIWKDYAKLKGITSKETDKLFPPDKKQTVILPDEDQAPTKRVSLIRIGDLEILPLDYIIDNVFEAASLMEVFGQTGSYKTFLLIDWAICITAGISWKGHEIEKPGPVVYFAGEGASGIKRRWTAACIKYKLTEQDLPFYVSENPGEVTDQAWIFEALKEIESLEESPVLIIIDTLNMNFGDGDENSTTDMTNFMHNVNYLKQKTGATIAWAHHPGHDNKGRSRGSSVKQNALDRTYQLIKKNEIVTMECVKSKETENPENIYLSLAVVELGIFDSNGKEVNSAVLIKSNPPAIIEMPITGQDEMKALEILKTIYSEQQLTLDNGYQESIPRVTKKDWLDRCVNEGITERTFYKIRTKLSDSGIIDIDRIHVTIL